MKHFRYRRKSSESEDRQMLSLESQHRELDRVGRFWTDVEVIDDYGESRTAKVPGRPLFNEMLRRIRRGEAEGIVAYSPNRLARNATDAGAIMQLLDDGKLKSLKFATFNFENTPQGKFILQMMFAEGKHYSDNLSVNIHLSIKTKLENGWLPNKAPLGYRNDQSTGTIVPDPERFQLMQRLWQEMASGTASPIVLMAKSAKWGLTMPRSRKQGGGPLSRPGIYRLLANPFYTGVMLWKGKIYKGKHTPMISSATFERVQELIHRPHSRRPLRQSFVFTGLLRCGECGFAVTAEEKINPYGRRYVYYHCSHRRVDYHCRQPVVSASALEDQVLMFIDALTIPEDMVAWMGGQLPATAKSQGVDEEALRASIARRLQSAQKEKSTLIQLRVRDLVDDAAFLAMQATLDREIIQLESDTAAPDRHVDWFELCCTVQLFISKAADWFRQGGTETKRAILTALGSNFQLRDKVFSAEARFPFTLLSSDGLILNGRAVVDDVRTLYEQCDKAFLDQLTAMREVIARCEALDNVSHSERGCGREDETA
jgi:DNA invertase Pin-like site-specific DNA recombinase